MFTEKSLGAALLALVALCAPAFGYSHYSQSITSSTSSLNIPATTHGIYSHDIAVMVRDGSTVRATSGYSYSIDGTYQVSLTFSPAVTSGTVDLYGALSCCTNLSTDWKVDVPGPTTQVRTCGYCTSSAPAVRNANSHNYAASAAATVTLDPYTFTAVKVYISDNRVIFGLSISSGSATCTGAPCRVDYSISGYPAGSVPLGHVNYNGDGTFGSISDDRPTSFQ